MAKKKTVADNQLSEDIEKLLTKKGVDEDVITEVTAKINDTNESEDADGDVLDKDDIKIDEDEVKDDDDEVEEIEEEDDEEVEDEDDLDDDDDLDDEEVEDEDVDAQGDDPLAKLNDPKFKEGFDKGFKFARELAKLDSIELGKDSDEEVDEVEEENDDEVEDADVSEADYDEDEEEAKEKASVVGDSINKLTDFITAKINRSYQERIQASEKVKSLVGNVDIMAFDSADGIYEFALQQNGVDTAKYQKGAYEGMIDMMLCGKNTTEVPVVVADAKSSFDKDFDVAFERLSKIDR